jgi:hypothetical protein
VLVFVQRRPLDSRIKVETDSVQALEAVLFASKPIPSSPRPQCKGAEHDAAFLDVGRQHAVVWAV